MRVRMRVTTNASGFCGFCGSFSQTVDIAYFSRFLACGSRVVFACGFVVLWIACGFWIARSALRVRNGKSRKKPRVEALSQAGCVSCARSALRVRWLKLRPRHPKKPKKAHDVVFGRACGFGASLWFWGELVVFGRACGFWASLWFLGELVDLRSKVVIKGKPLKDLTTESKSC